MKLKSRTSKTIELRNNINFKVELTLTFVWGEFNQAEYCFTEFINGTHDFEKSFETVEELNNFIQSHFDFKVKPINEFTNKHQNFLNLCGVV